MLVHRRVPQMNEIPRLRGQGMKKAHEDTRFAKDKAMIVPLSSKVAAADPLHISRPSSGADTLVLGMADTC